MLGLDIFDVSNGLVRIWRQTGSDIVNYMANAITPIIFMGVIFL